MEITYRDIPDDEFLPLLEARYAEGLSNANEVLQKHIAKPFGLYHPLVGPIGLFYGDKNRGLCHLMTEREEAHTRTPTLNPPAQEALEQVIHAAVFGAPVVDMPNAPKSTVGLHLIESPMQVVVAPFWRNPADGKIVLPIDLNTTWLLTGYQMEAPRQERMSAWLLNPNAAPIRKWIPSKR